MVTCVRNEPTLLTMHSVFPIHVTLLDMIILVMFGEEYKHTGACELWGSVAVNSTVSWDVMLCRLLEIHRHYGGTSVNDYQSHPRMLESYRHYGGTSVSYYQSHPRMLESYRHCGGTSVNDCQITWSHIPGFCILYESCCGAIFGIPLLLWSSWSRCYRQLIVQAVVLQR
jgi:hypothetical protein